MKLNLISFLLIILITKLSFAQLPPLIDREVFLGDPEISGAQLSPDGKYITFIKPFNGIRNIWIKERIQKFDDARPLTADSLRAITQYFWTRDGKYVLFLQDKGGNENFHIFAVDPTQKGNPVPTARDLTPIENVRAYIYDLPKNNPNIIIVGLNDRKPEFHDVYRIEISSGNRTLMRENNENVASWIYDLNGELRLGYRQTQDGGWEILKVDGDKLEQIYSVNSEESASPLRFTPDGNSFYLQTNKGDLDKIQLMLFDLKTGKTKLVDKDPLDEVDFSGILFSEKTEEILATYYIGEKRRMYFHQKEFEKDFKRLEKVLPKGDISIADMTEDEMTWLVYVGQDTDPGTVYIFDRKSGKAEVLYRVRPNLPSEHLAQMKPVKYKARDGMTIYAYLTLPKGIPPKNLPVVMLIHGGPWARDFWGYNALAQFLANRGYAVFQPNFRGSTGYGKKYLNAGNFQWGTGYMQHDITDGAKYLIKEGIADPKRIAIAGGSYGGYATLAGLAFTPDLYACGFDIVGPSSIITLLKSIPPYWKPIVKMFHVRVGDPDNPEHKKRLEEQSPLHSAKNIVKPLYIVQGANDPRVKKAESDQIVVALRDLGRDVEYMCAPDEGHGFLNQENRLAMIVAMEKFFAKHLGGRMQQDVRDAIQKKFDAITVDIKTVTLPQLKTKTEASLQRPMFDGNKIKPQSLKYAMKIEARGQKFDMSVKRDITEAILNGKNILRIIDNVTGFMGGTDTLDLDRNTLLPIRRSIKQGPATVILNFTESSVDGKILMSGQEMPISAKFSSITLTDGIGTELPFATIPFEVGYKATFDQFELMKASTKSMKVEVVAEEKIKIDAGEFDTYKVEVKPSEGDEGATTLWYMKDNQALVKSKSNLPASMGGGTVIMELTK